MSLEHDQRCADQDADLKLLKEQFRVIGKDLDMVVSRAQQLVNEMHAQNVKQAEMQGDVTHIKAKVDTIERSLESDFALRSEFDWVQRVVYGAVAIVLTLILTGAVGVVLTGGMLNGRGLR
jgi:hypothetical protein